MEVKEYIIVSANEQDVLVKLINDKIAKGYQPIGGPTERKIYNHQTDSAMTLMQAMVK